MLIRDETEYESIIRSGLYEVLYSLLSSSERFSCVSASCAFLVSRFCYFGLSHARSIDFCLVLKILHLV